MIAGLISDPNGDLRAPWYRPELDLNRWLALRTRLGSMSLSCFTAEELPALNRVMGDKHYEVYNTDLELLEAKGNQMFVHRKGRKRS